MRAQRVAALILPIFAASCATTEKVAKPAPAGEWYESSRDLKISLPEFAFTEGNYTAEIVRHYSDENELRLLRIAESVYPNRDRVQAARDNARLKDNQEPSKGEGLWWFSAFDGVRIPYTITSAAVRYYSDLVQTFRDQKFEITGGKPVSRCTMRYASVINHHKYFVVEGRSFPECYAVTMELRWTQDNGPGRVMGFVKRRLVLVDLKGKVLGVFLDGPAEVTLN
ncbi:MAG: hypothetical protein IT365_19415 [Candidatus Hydrogenedentes bacterium]|nr:hypothetical protein [Candidatus Hydrogenedentota bacterium]